VSLLLPSQARKGSGWQIPAVSVGRGGHREREPPDGGRACGIVRRAGRRAL